MKTRVLILVTALSLLGFLSCSKQEEPVPEQQEEVKALSVPEAVEVLTKSLTKEDLEGLSLFLKQGEAERSLYLEIARDGEPLVSGEVSLVTEKGFRYVGLDLLVLGQIRGRKGFILFPQFVQDVTFVVRPGRKRRKSSE